MQSFIGCKLYVLKTLRTFIGILFTVLHHPHTRRNANVIITAKRRHDVIIVLSLRHILAGMCQQIGPSKPPSEFMSMPLQWRHNYRDGVSNHQPHDCLLNRLFRRRSKKTSKLRVNGLCEGNSPVNGEFPAQSASNAKNVSIWWRHHGWEITEQQIQIVFYSRLKYID